MASPRVVELEVMTKNYAKLCEILSPVIDSLLPKLLSEKVITYEDKKNILVQQTGTCRAEALLDGTIKTSLSVDYPDSFYKLLRAMKDTQSNVCIQLVESMIGELPSDMVTRFNLRSDEGKQEKSNDQGKLASMIKLYMHICCQITVYLTIKYRSQVFLMYTRDPTLP